jgi:hypothetical protein
MHSPISDVLLDLDRSRAALRAAVDRVPTHLRDQPPGADRWSVAGVLEHLALVDEGYTTAVAVKIAEARVAGLGREERGDRELPPAVAARLADRTERRVAPESSHPRGLDCGAAWARAESARSAFRRLLTDADGLALSRVVHEHPRLGVLNVYQWGGFLAAHERRHTEQVLEIASQLTSR